MKLGPVKAWDLNGPLQVLEHLRGRGVDALGMHLTLTIEIDDLVSLHQMWDQNWICLRLVLIEDLWEVLYSVLQMDQRKMQCSYYELDLLVEHLRMHW